MTKPDITVIRGDNISIEVDIKDAGVPIDITGLTIFFTVKSAFTDDVSDGTAIISKTVTTLSDPVNGIAHIELTPNDTNKPVGGYYYDIQFKDSEGVITSLPSGVIEIVPDITRRTI